MTTEEVMHRLVPLARELEPVAAIPPVCVELAIRKAYGKSDTTSRNWIMSLTRELCEGTQDVLKDDQEDQQKSDHEREKQTTNGLGYDQSKV